MSLAPECSSKPQKKDWHSSKRIRKRTRYLLEHLDEEIPTDVTFLVGGGQEEPRKLFKCHKFVLALVSSMFQAMFYGTFPETEGTIAIPDISPAAFQIMLCYAYTDDTDGLDLYSAMNTLYCAKKYLITKLERKCRSFIQFSTVCDNLAVQSTMENACLIFQQARLISEDNLAELALAEIRRATDFALKCEDFITLSPACLQEVLDQPALTIPEPKLYQNVIRWAKHNAEAIHSASSLREFLGSLVHSIRFPLFTGKELADGPVKDGIFLYDELTAVFRNLFYPTEAVAAFQMLPREQPLRKWLCKVYMNDIVTGNLLACLEIDMRVDLAPECCGFLSQLIDGLYHIQFAPFENQYWAYSNDYSAELEFRHSIVEERNCLSHSVKGAVWYEWNVKDGSVCDLRIVAWKKPGPNHSAVFGHICCSEAEKEFSHLDEFWGFIPEGQVVFRAYK